MKAIMPFQRKILLYYADNQITLIAQQIVKITINKDDLNTLLEMMLQAYSLSPLQCKIKRTYLTKSAVMCCGKVYPPNHLPPYFPLQLIYSKAHKDESSTIRVGTALSPTRSHFL